MHLIITPDVLSRFIHDKISILQTLNPAISQIIPAINERDLVFISSLDYRRIS